MGVGGVVGSLGGISFDITAIDNTGSGVDSAVENLQKLETQSENTTTSLRQIAIAFGSLTALTATAVVASDRVVTLERSTGRAAITLGQTTREVFKYVQALSNATDSQEEVGATITYLSRAGVEWGTELTTIYNEMDMLGDAVGRTSTDIAQELIPTFKGLGIEISDISKYMDMLAYASNTTLFDIGTWSFILRRNGEAFIKYGVQVEDTIAIIAKMNELGIPQRKIMTIVNEALQDMGGNLKVVEEGEKDLLAIQEKLNDSQQAGANITKMYLYDMKMAGGDIKERVRLSNAYRRTMYERPGDDKDLINQKTEIQKKIDVARAAPTPTFIEALGKADTRLSGDVLPNAVAEAKTESVGAAVDYAKIGDMFTGTEKATHDMDVAMQKTLGENVGADVASSMVYLRNISGIITTVASVLAIIQGFAGTTAVATSATAIKGGASAEALAGAGVGAAGLTTAAGLGAVLVAGIAGATLAAIGATEATKAASTYQGEEEKKQFITKGGTEEEWEEFLSEQRRIREILESMGENAPTQEERVGTPLETKSIPTPANPFTPEQIASNEAKLPKMTTDEYAGQYPSTSQSTITADEYVGQYEEGGVIPGPVGEPKLATVHGGETVIPVKRSGGFGSQSVGMAVPPWEDLATYDKYNWSESKKSKEEYENKRIETLPGTLIANIVKDVLDIIDANVPETPDDINRGGMFGVGFGNYDKGGVVPGPIGEPQPAIVHGGETVIPYRSPLPGVSNFGNYGDAGKDLPQQIAAAISEALSGMSKGLSVTIETMTVSKDYPIDKMLADLERKMSSSRKQQGVRST